MYNRKTSDSEEARVLFLQNPFLHLWLSEWLPNLLGGHGTKLTQSDPDYSREFWPRARRGASVAKKWGLREQEKCYLRLRGTDYKENLRTSL